MSNIVDDIPRSNQDSKHGDEFSWDNCLFEKALESPWETIFFNDRMVKHEVRLFYRNEGTDGPCHSDVIVNFVRNPLSDGSDLRRVDFVLRQIGFDNDGDFDDDDFTIVEESLNFEDFLFRNHLSSWQ